MTKASNKNASFVRFSESEYKLIASDADLYNESIPGLLKSVYFGIKLPRPFMFPDDARRVLVAINRLGNNANQIARHLNAGFRQDFRAEIQDLIDGVNTIRRVVLGAYGNSAN